MESENCNKFQKVINFFQKYGIIIISIIVGIIGILSIFITAYFNTTFYHNDEKTYFKYSFGIFEIIISIVAILMIAVICKKIIKKIPSKFIMIPLIIFDAILFFYWINILKLTPQDDQALIHEMAISFLSKNMTLYLSTAGYLFLYPFQFGITLFVSIVYKIFGQNFLYIQYINVICSIINILILYYISKIIFNNNEDIQKILVILLAVFSLYWMFFNVHVYGNIIGLTLALISVLLTMLYLNNNKIYLLILAGISISISILLKTNYAIFLCGIILVLILNIIKKWNFKTLIVIPAILIGYLVINIGYSFLLEYKYNLKLPEGVPMISYVYMAISEPTNLSEGWYTGIHSKIFSENNYNVEQTKKATYELIQNRLKYFFENPKEFIRYFSIKIGSTWLNPTFQTIWCSLPGSRYTWNADYAHYLSYHEKALSMLGGKLYNVEENIFNIYQIIVFLFAGIGIFKNSKDLDLKKALLPIIFIGGFIFHIIWETKAIYVIQYYFILLPFSAYGLNYFIEKIYNRKSSK